jgi:hypothetical protein
LGNIISVDGIVVDPDEIKAIKRIYGSFRLLRRFIKVFSKIASSIASFQKKGVKSEWTSKCEETFQQSKIIFTSATKLKITYLDEDFVVCTDACKEGIFGVPSQKDHVVCFEYRKLKEHERNYATHDLQLVAIVHALKMWRHYLTWKKFDLRTNHCGLKHLFGEPTLNSRKTIWLDFLSEYDFEIKHINEKQNQLTNALNKRSHEVNVSTINMYMMNLKDKIFEATNLDHLYLQITENLEKENS